MSQGEDKKPVIIKKVKKGGHGFHGGAWKLAYADFVTAMMAFFLLMWLLGSTTKAQRQGIADYFENPLRVSMSGGEGSGDAVRVMEGGGEDLTRSVGQIKKSTKGPTNQTLRKSTEDEQRIAAMKKKLMKAIQSNPKLKEFEKQLKIDVTDEGLRIQILDAEKRPMFALASDRLADYARDILTEITNLVNELPNKVSISGHTDSRPFGGGGLGFSNWELSANRANAARRAMLRSGLDPTRIMRVEGLADSIHLNPEEPYNPINRRISILVLYKEAEESIRKKGTVLEMREGEALQSLPSPSAPQDIEPPVPLIDIRPRLGPAENH